MYAFGCMADGKTSGASPDAEEKKAEPKQARDPKADARARPDEKPTKPGDPVTRFG